MQTDVHALNTSLYTTYHHACTPKHSWMHTITHAYKGIKCIHTQVMAAKRRYEVGLQKLEFTEQQVVIMQNELTELKPKLIK